MKRRKITDEQIKEIIKLYSEGMGSSKIGKIFGLDKSTILRKLRKNNIKIRKFELNINIGDKFGRWTIISDGKRKRGRWYFLCECSCPDKTRREVDKDGLRRELSQSCGCLHKEILREKKFNSGVDYTGQVFGRLTILYEIERVKNGDRQVMAQCSCDGNIKKYRLDDLKSGHSTSCGCYAAEFKKEYKTNKKKDYEEKHPLFCKVEEIRDCENEPGIEVRCKHSDCRKWFKPTKNQLQNRVSSLERPRPEWPGVERNFYCSEECKRNCDTYGAVTIPKSLRNVKTQSRCNQQTNRKALLDLQIDECGYNYCEKCGNEFEASDLIIHHNIMVGVDHTMADDMSHQILVCKEHHEHKGCY